MDPSNLNETLMGPAEVAGGMDLVRQTIDRYRGEPAMLIPMMQDLQTAQGYLPKTDLQLLARALQVPLSRIYGIATFYASFRLVPKGEHTIQLCQGTVCYLKGADKISAAIQKEFHVAPGGTSPDGKLTFCPVNCVGACALAPVMLVDGQYHGGLTVNSAVELLHHVTEGKPAAVKAPSAGERANRE